MYSLLHIEVYNFYFLNDIKRGRGNMKLFQQTTT